MGCLKKFFRICMELEVSCALTYLCLLLVYLYQVPFVHMWYLFRTRSFNSHRLFLNSVIINLSLLVSCTNWIYAETTFNKFCIPSSFMFPSRSRPKIVLLCFSLLTSYSFDPIINASSGTVFSYLIFHYSMFSRDVVFKPDRYLFVGHVIHYKKVLLCSLPGTHVAVMQLFLKQQFPMWFRKLKQEKWEYKQRKYEQPCIIWEVSGGNMLWSLKFKRFCV